MGLVRRPAEHWSHLTAVAAERAERYRAAGWWDDRGLEDGLEAAAATRPTATAVVDDERRVTWAELDRLVVGAVDHLVARGVGAGDAVVLVAGNTVAGVVAYHALLRVGATTALLDRRCGPADVRSACDALGAAATVVVPGAERERLGAAGADRSPVLLEDLAAGRATVVGADDSVPTATDRDRPAVILFTSGTTSRPKGVVHSLNTLTAGARNFVRITGVDASSVLFLVSPLMSITGVMQTHAAADAHATLVLDDRFEPSRSLDRLNEHGATVLGGAPVIAERLLRTAVARGDRHIALRTLALGGSMLPMPLLELAMDGFGIEVARVYGSSEAPNSTGSLPGEERARRLADDGALMPGTEVRVGSAEHAQEGLVRGPAVCLGYVDPEHHERAFADGWFRTGDAVELHDGRLTVVGRLNDVVNRNGLKISLAEIETALAGLPGVVEHAAYGVPDDETGERLVVAVRVDAGAEVSLDSVCAHLRGIGTATRKLPEQLVVWDEPLPRTASGKVVRAQLGHRSSERPAQYAARLRAPR
jgi:acyl-CoA synthetase (AMP-forming)/AMP-acid ligase II